MIARAEADPGPQVILPSDDLWILGGNTSLVQRSQAPVCVPPVGREQEEIILARSGSAPMHILDQQIVLRIPNTSEVAEIVFYGAIFDQSPYGGDRRVFVNWQDPELGLQGDVRYIPMDSAAACDIVVVDFPLGGLTTSTVGIAPSNVDQQIAIYNATLFATLRPLHPNDPPSSHSSESRIFAIALPCALLPFVIIPLCIWYHTRRRRRSRDSSLRPYTEMASHHMSEDALVRGTKVHALLSSYSILRRGPMLFAGGADWQGSEQHRESARPPTDAGSASEQEDEDPEELAAIRRALRRAGLSTQALLHSLNRVRPDADIDISSTAPPRYDG